MWRCAKQGHGNTILQNAAKTYIGGDRADQAVKQHRYAGWLGYEQAGLT